MEKAGAYLSFVFFPVVMYSFTNPDADRYAREFNLPLTCDAKADERSWQETGMFLKTVLQ